MPDSEKWEKISLREYVEALFAEQARAIEVAERERNNAAQMLATTLTASIHEGDDRLREHVANQITQIKIALESANALELERIAKTVTEIDSVRKELTLNVNAANEAVKKAETATEKRFEGVNEWRAQSADRERSQAEERAKLQAQFVLKEVADNQFTALRNTSEGRYEIVRQQLADLSARLDLASGTDQGQQIAKRDINTARTLMVGLALVFFAALTIVTSIAIATHGFSK